MSTQLSQMHHAPATSGRGEQKASLDKRLSGLFWAFLFILTGTIWLFPEDRVPNGTWLSALGLILLGLNAVRYFNGIPVRVLPTILGALAMVIGLAEFAGMNLPVISLTFIAIGVSIVFDLLSPRRTSTPSS